MFPADRTPEWPVRRSASIAGSFVLALACAPAAAPGLTEASRAEAEVRLRLANYATAAAAVDAAASASFFSPRGVLFEPGIPPIAGADSVRAFVASFPGVEVDSAMLRADTIEVFGGTVLVWGTYFERLHFPGQPESAQHGRFVMEWRRDPQGAWFIERYYRVPLPAGWRDAP